MSPAHWKGNFDGTAKTYSLPPSPALRSQSCAQHVLHLACRAHSDANGWKDDGYKVQIPNCHDRMQFSSDETTNMYETPPHSPSSPLRPPSPPPSQHQPTRGFLHPFLLRAVNIRAPRAFEFFMLTACGRVAGTHGDVLNAKTEGFRIYTLKFSAYHTTHRAPNTHHEDHTHAQHISPQTQHNVHRERREEGRDERRRQRR